MSDKQDRADVPHGVVGSFSLVATPPGVPEGKKADPEQRAARDALLELFESAGERVFYSKQLEVLHEARWFHWVTNRALNELISEGVVAEEVFNLEHADFLRVVRHKSYRYPRRESAHVVALVDEYSHPYVSQDVGDRGESLILDGFTRHQFVVWGRNTRVFRDREWTASEHDLDFIFERDGVAYGVEVKNRLGYMSLAELKVKVDMCDALGIRPVFAARMLPRTWIDRVRVAGGFSLIMKYQMYPKGRRDLVDRIRDELELPVDTPNALEDGTMQRFLNWHIQNV